MLEANFEHKHGHLLQSSSDRRRLNLIKLTSIIYNATLNIEYLKEYGWEGKGRGRN